MDMLKEKSLVEEKESYIDKLARLVNPDLQKETEFRPEMSSEEIAKIMSDRLIKVIKNQFEEAKRRMETSH